MVGIASARGRVGRRVDRDLDLGANADGGVLPQRREVSRVDLGGGCEHPKRVDLSLRPGGGLVPLHREI